MCFVLIKSFFHFDIFIAAAASAATGTVYEAAGATSAAIVTAEKKTKIYQNFNK